MDEFVGCTHDVGGVETLGCPANSYCLDETIANPNPLAVTDERQIVCMRCKSDIPHLAVYRLNTSSFKRENICPRFLINYFHSCDMGPVECLRCVFCHVRRRNSNPHPGVCERRCRRRRMWRCRRRNPEHRLQPTIMRFDYSKWLIKNRKCGFSIVGGVGCVRRLQRLLRNRNANPNARMWQRSRWRCGMSGDRCLHSDGELQHRPLP